MTKFILIGGYPYKAKDGGKAMCAEAAEGFDLTINILICMFAREKRNWKEKFEERRDFFQKNLPNIKLNFTLATEKDFIQQVKENDIIFFSGGDTRMLMGSLAKAPGWEKQLAHKAVMGSSAGADMLSTHNYDLEFFKCADGLGLVPVKTLVHFGSEKYKPPIGWENALEELRKYKNGLPVLAIQEGEYKVFFRKRKNGNG